MNLRYLSLFALLILLLSGCNIFRVFPRADINLSLVDGSDRTLSEVQFTERYKFDSTTGLCNFQGVFIEKTRLMANARPGSIGVDIESYTVDYFWADGEVIPTGSGEAFRGTLTLSVPDGVVCSDFPSAEEPNDCTINTPGATYAQGATVMSQSFAPSDFDIYTSLVRGPDGVAGSGDEDESSGAYASIVVEGTDANGNPFSKQLSPVTMIIFAVCE